MRARIATALAAFVVVAALLGHAVIRQATGQTADPIGILQTLELFYGTGVNGSASRIAASSGDVAAAVATATLTSSATKTAYLQGFDINGTGATSGVGIPCTVTGVIGGTLTFDFAVIAGATLNNAASFRFPAPIPASAVNTNLVVSCPSFGTGNLHASINAYGFLN